MSETSVPEERTELPTEKRMGQLRREGAIFSSHEMVQVAGMLTAYYGLGILWPILIEDFKIVFRTIFLQIANPEPITFRGAYMGFLGILKMFGPPVFLFIASVAAVSGFGVMFQTKWNIKEKWVKWDFGFLNPIGGIKKIFSIQGLINTGKALLKLILILPIAYYALKGEASQMIQLLHTSIFEIFLFTGKEMFRLFWKIMYVLIAIAIFDYLWGKFQWFKSNKMTKDEVKDERKATEGDETTRRKIVAKGMARIAKRLRESVPRADVIITNPTHYSVALQYDRKTMKAPTVVAKGTGFMALRIREIAKEAGVPILERKPLARALYASVEVGREIPHDLYKAVAEVLAYVYRLKNPWAKKPQEIKSAGN